MQTSGELPQNSGQKKCGEKCATLSRSKDELRYWKDKIRQVPNSPYFYIELQRDKVRRKVSLGTSNKDAAARRAREIWNFVRAFGWRAYIEKFEPDKVPAAPVADPDLGQFIAAVEATA